MAIPNPYQQYRQQQINTSSQEKLLIMLYDGAIRFCRQAKKNLEERQYEMSHHSLIKVQNILIELISSLNTEFEIAQNLSSLYDYLYSRLVEANLKKDCAIIDEVIEFLTELRNTWAEAALKVKSEGMVSFEEKCAESRCAAFSREL